jgi:16S rRNA (cytidine1402-2'-O)-methyltransferase
MARRSSFLMAGRLLIVATPIGNLEDITLRALRVLREADLIAAEDTRRTSRLLQHYSISTPTTSLHEHNERQKLPMLLERLARGEQIALVSDAGTPAISDPGARLVAAAHDRGVRVEPIPGPSAVTAALSVSGFEGDGFSFLGFPPTRAKDRLEWLDGLSRTPGISVFFEAPHRIQRTLGELVVKLGDRPIVVCRELTKAHEQLVKRPNIDELVLAVPRLGEFVVVIGPRRRQAQPSAPLPADEHLWTEFCHMTEKKGLGRRMAIAALAQAYHLPARTIYQALERAKRNRSNDL